MASSESLLFIYLDSKVTSFSSCKHSIVLLQLNTIDSYDMFINQQHCKPYTIHINRWVNAQQCWAGLMLKMQLIVWNRRFISSRNDLQTSVHFCTASSNKSLINPSRANPTKCSNTLKQFVGRLRFYADSNPVCGMPDVSNGEDTWLWSRLEIRLNDSKQFIIMNI